MGYGYYERDGMKRGYMVPDVCHEDGCEAKIDRGLAYLCYGCALYFCGKHLGYWSDVELECFAGVSGQTCSKCAVVEPDEDDQ